MMKKILHISKYYYPFVGGTEGVCQYIAEAFPEYENRVICFNDGTDTIGSEVNGIQILRVGCFGKIASQSLSFSYYGELRHMIELWSPDLILFHHPNPLVAWHLLMVLPAKTKLLLHWHLDITKQKYIYPLVKPTETALLKRAHVIFVTSPNYRDASKVLEPYLNKVVVIPNTIDTSRLALTKEEEIEVMKVKQKYDNKKIIFFVGRHVEYKGLQYLLDAEKYIKEECRILIAGSGPLTKQLKGLCVSERIMFLGRISDLQLKYHLYAADIFAFPSITKNEAFGLALAEAMYCRCVPVTFTIKGSGVNWVNLDRVTGLEVENSKSLKYAEAIDTLLKDDVLRAHYAENAHNRVIQNFTMEKVKCSIKHVYDDLGV